MDSSGVRRQQFTSLVGAVPLADVLADLPLPVALPTPTEESLLGAAKKLSADTKRLLDSTNSTTCSKVAETLLSVDMSFLDVKEPCQTVPLAPSMKAPPLISALASQDLFPQPVVRLEKLDPSQYRSPMRSSGYTAQDAIVPLQNTKGATLEKDVPRKKKKRKQRPVDSSSLQSAQKVVHKPKRRRLSSSSSGETLVKPRKPPKLKQKEGTSLRVSIGRNQLSDSLSSQHESVMTVQVPRSKLRGSLGHSHQRSSLNPILSDYSTVYGGTSLDTFGGGELMLLSRTQDTVESVHELQHQDAVNVIADQVVPNEKPHKTHKKKKKHARRSGDPTKMANLQRFTDVLESLFDQVISEDNLLERSAIMAILSHVASLKQMGILHMVSVDNLVQLIGVMDKHLLDTANLHLTSATDEMDCDPKIWRDAAKERILRSADAALIVLHITTAPNMPNNVHLEESIEQIISLTRYHLETNIYPQFDPVYRAENKVGGVLPRQKRRAGNQSASKEAQAIYHKMTEVLENIALLVETQPLTDTTLLMLSSLGTFPFFVENINLLQLSALRLVRAIFSRYEKHRDLILEDIFASLRRLPTTKRNLRSFKLYNGQHIQMLTALVLQLIQCIVISSKNCNRETSPEEQEGQQKEKMPDAHFQMTTSYDLALSTGNNFLSKFLKKCCSGKDEDDFRPLFENFVQDLLTTLNLPEWPASEVLLTLLGILLVHSFSNRSNEQSLRLTSLDHLGVIAARLRKDTTTSSEQDHEELIEILSQALQSKIDHRSPSPTTKMDAFSENAQHLQKVLIAYLNKRGKSDPACAFARDFYIGQWLYDTQLDLEKALKDNPQSPTAQVEDSNVLDGHEDIPTISSSAVILQQSEFKKEKIQSLLDPKTISALKSMEGILDEKSAAVVTRYLASTRALSRSFDMYLQKLIRVSNEPAVHVRTRAMKALSTITAADPGILSRPDMQRAVEFRFRDTSTLVREAAVDLVGRFVLSRPELTSQYYDMICERIRDAGVSVRKRVIKILKDICVLQPDFPQISDICVRMIRRIGDEEGIKCIDSQDKPVGLELHQCLVCSRTYNSLKPDRRHLVESLAFAKVAQPESSDGLIKIYNTFGEYITSGYVCKDLSAKNTMQLVTSVFRELWFTTPPESQDKKEILVRRVTNITAVVGLCKEYEWFEQLLEQMLKCEDQTAVQAVLTVSQSMVDCLVEVLLTLDENSAKGQSSSSPKLVSCVITLYLFCNVKPSLLLRHATTLHPYLSSTCAAQRDVMVLHFVSKILKEVIPLMEHPSESFLAGLEEDLVKLTMKHGQLLIHSCLECLGAVVNNVTHNYTLIKDCFQRFLRCLEQMHALHSQNPSHPQLKTHRASLLRSLFSVGVVCKFFDVDSFTQKSTTLVSRQVLQHLVYFFKQGDDEIQIKTVKGLGFFCIRFPESMLEPEIKQLYNSWLTKDFGSMKKIEVLRNLHNYLKEVEAKLKTADTSSTPGDKPVSEKTNLLQFGDQHSSVSSNVSQAFLQPVLESFMNSELQVRLAALQAIILILRQGLVHPAQCIPYLMAMSTDTDPSIKVKVDKQLSEHTSRYGHLMQTQLMAGVKKSFEFQNVIAGEVPRGYCCDGLGNQSSLLAHVYSLVRSTKQHRRAFLRALLRYFEDYEKNPPVFLLYLADNLAYLPYNTQEEPLFVVHHIDMSISVTGSNLLQQFKEILNASGVTADDDEEDVRSLSQQSYDMQQLSECCHSCQGCFLLLLLKQHLKKCYGLTDSKCQKYSPAESSKAYDKAITRKQGVLFDPKQVVEKIQAGVTGARKVNLSKDECIKHYLEFKQLMNKLDPFEGDEEGSDGETVPPAPLPEPSSLPQQLPQRLPVDTVTSRGSRASSTCSTGSQRGRSSNFERDSKPKKKHRVIISSDESDEDDPDYRV